MTKLIHLTRKKRGSGETIHNPPQQQQPPPPPPKYSNY